MSATRRSHLDAYDHIVVGAGSAGCVLAHRLTEDGQTRVLLIESGGRDRSPRIHIPSALPWLDPRLDWQYGGEPDPTREGRTDRWAAGRVLGGSSSINGMVWVRGHRTDFDGWASAGCRGWDFDAVLPYFKRQETYTDGGDPRYRGRSGPQFVSRNRAPHVLDDLFVEAAVHVGHAYNDDYNGAEQEGVAHGQLSQRNGLRHSTARAYLRPARRRKNLTVVDNAHAHRIVFSGSRAIGVEYCRDGRLVRAHASGEVLLSAGAIGSPALLMRSGVGPADHLREVGIPIVCDLPGVGQNLQEQIVAMMQYEVTLQTFNCYRTPAHIARAAIEFALRRSGPITTSVAHVLLFGRAERATGTDHEILFAPLGVTAGADEAFGGPHDLHRMRLMEEPVVTVFPHTLHTETRGEIRLRSANPEDTPRIRYHLLADPAEMRCLMAAVDQVRRIVAAPPMRAHVVRSILPGDHVTTANEWEKFIRRSAFRAEHPVGTCAMGTDDAAVVDPLLRVRGVHGLRVIDASVMPHITSGNTNAPTVMIAEKGADLVRAGGAA